MQEITSHPLSTPDPSTLAVAIQKILDSDKPYQTQADTLLQIAVGLVNSPGAIYFKEEGTKLVTISQFLSRQAASWSFDLVKDCRSYAEKAMAEERATISPLEKMQGISLISCPLPGEKDRSCLCVLALLGHNQPEPFLIILQLITVALDQIFSQQQDQPLFRQLAAIYSSTGGSPTLQDLTTLLKNRTSATIVAIGGTRGGNQLKLHHISDIVTLDRRTELANEFRGVMEESLKTEVPLRWPPQEEMSSSLVLKGLVQKAQMKSGTALALPINNHLHFAAVFLYSKEQDEVAAISELKAVAPVLGILFTEVMETGKKNLQQKLFWTLQKKLALSLTLAVLLALSTIPVPFRLNVDATLKPVMLRYVVAGFDAILKDVVVEPGDQLEKEDLLATLDGREIELELTAITAESAKALKMRDNYLAKGNIAAAQIALLEYQQLVEREKLLRKRQEKLELLSPITGIVLAGDLKRQIGGPVTKGKALFEIAPLEKVLVKLGIPDMDIGHVQKGMKVEIHFDSFPQKCWQTTIKNISPQSEASEGKNLFFATAEIANEDLILQPGMRGWAAIDSGRKNLIWIYFHKPWYALLRLLDSFG